VLIREATNTKFIGFGLILSEFEPMVFRTRGVQVHHYITDAVILNITRGLALYFLHHILQSSLCFHRI
jgi:hypothetical protein